MIRNIFNTMKKNLRSPTGFDSKSGRLWAWFCLMLITPIACFGQSYTITDLGSNSWSYSAAHAINGDGHVVGEYEPTNFFYVLAFLFENGALSDLRHLNGAPYAIAYGINDTDQVVGESATANNTHAFLYSNGTMTDLGTLAGTITGYSSAHAINRAGQIVGESSVSFAQASTIHAVLYDGSTKTDLGALGGDYSSASAINNSGVVVGESDIVSQAVTNVHAFKYSNRTISDLGTLGGDYSSAKGINDSGVIIGESDIVISGSTYTHAFIYRNGTISDLGTLGGSASSASAINTAGLVVGYATDTNEVSNAFLYDGSKMINLNDFIPPGSGWTNLSSADAINDAGQIAGSGFLADGSYHAYLLTMAAPLTVSITNPIANTSFEEPATFSVGATVSDNAGTVTNVEFLVNNASIGNSTVPPYSATANNLSAGTYTLSAIASDNTGLKATNFITIIVTAVVADVPPTVIITNPAPNATFQAPANFSIGASASDSDGTVTNVQFLVNSTVVGNSTVAPYSAAANNLSGGTYTLTAIAADNAGLTATDSIMITVTAVVADLPPTVIITNPAPNATFQAPANFSMGASASDSDGAVTNVQFLVNSTIVGNSTVAPYSATVSSLSAGTYTLSAVASDNAGLTATNAITVTVLNSAVAPITLLNPAFNGNSFSFSLATQAGVTYQGQFVSPLGTANNWITFTNFVGDGSTVQVSDWKLSQDQGFYRVVAH
jgi:probable HAF family extracellular repeat protein